MTHLSHPLPNISAEEIFEECIKTFKDDDYKTRLNSCLKYVKADSSSFEKKMPNEISDFVPSQLPSTITTDEFLKVYHQKFVPQKSPGRKFYDQIIMSPPHGICPICGVRPISNLDHYLPKAQFPTLQVTPQNLVPSCRDCNFDKHTYVISKAEDAPLSPYFDDVSKDRWLAVELLPSQSVLYYADSPSSWPKILQARVKRHLKLYNLEILYGSNAVREICDFILLWKKIYHEAGLNSLCHYFKENRDSAEANELNSWRSALYRGLVSQIEVVELWMQD